MNVVVNHPTFRSFAPHLAELLGAGHTVRFVSVDECDQPGARFDDVHVLLTARFPTSWGPRFPALRLLHAAGAGLDKIDASALPPGARLCCTFGHGPSIAEYVIMAMLALQRKLLPADRSLRAGRWVCTQYNPAVPLPATLAGKTAILLGTGAISSATARLCRALDMDCIGVNRTGRAVPGEAYDRCVPLAGLADLLPVADFLVLALPLNETTRGLVDRTLLARLKTSAFLINVARGPVVDESALFEALQSGALAGAALDVWYDYPPAGSDQAEPSRLPFRELGNVIMTPHMSGTTRATFQHRVKDVAHNVRAVAAGQALRNEVSFRPAGVTGASS